MEWNIKILPDKKKFMRRFDFFALFLKNFKRVISQQQWLVWKKILCKQNPEESYSPHGLRPFRTVKVGQMK